MLIRKINCIKDFDEFISENENVCIKFSADWCQPCKVMSQRLSSIDCDKVGNVLLGEVDISENEECEQIAERYGVVGIPCLIFFKNKDIIDRTVGLVPMEKVYDCINKLLQ